MKLSPALPQGKCSTGCVLLDSNGLSRVLLEGYTRGGFALSNSQIAIMVRDEYGREAG
jgi:hypothetical protein